MKNPPNYKCKLASFAKTFYSKTAKIQNTRMCTWNRKTLWCVKN